MDFERGFPGAMRMTIILRFAEQLGAACPKAADGRSRSRAMLETLFRPLAWPELRALFLWLYTFGLTASPNEL